MGLEVLEEFRPVTPIRTVPTARTFNNRPESSDPEITKEISELKKEEEEECHTPRSPSQTLKTPLICPPAPKKPRLAARRNSGLPSQGFFKVPNDLASLFMVHNTKPSKKIKASS